MMCIVERVTNLPGEEGSRRVGGIQHTVTLSWWPTGCQILGSGAMQFPGCEIKSQGVKEPV